MASTDDSAGGRHSELAGAAAALPGRRVPRVVRQFLDTEASGGVVLLAAAMVALVWANSPWSGSEPGSEVGCGVEEPGGHAGPQALAQLV